MRKERRWKTSRGRCLPNRGFSGSGGFNPSGADAAPAVGFGQEVKGARRCSRRGKGRRGGRGESGQQRCSVLLKRCNGGAEEGGPVRNDATRRAGGEGARPVGGGQRPDRDTRVGSAWTGQMGHCVGLATVPGF
jgi:hypothetical protein